MRYDLLKRIEATDPLAQLFNQYLNGLSTPAILCAPSYVTMAEVRARYAKTGKRKARRHLKHSARRFFELTVLRNSLHDVHHHVAEAIALLEGFFATYEGNLTRYATEARLKSIEQYGSDQDDDWEPDGTDEQGQPRWKAAYRDDEASIAPYTLHAALGYHFGTDARGEHLGTSGPDAYYPYSTLVENQSAFSFRKMLTAVTGKDVTFTQVADDGTQTPMTLADHLEDELNEDLRGEALVYRFNAVLGMCASLASHYHRLSAASPAPDYQLLLDGLRQVQQVQTIGQPPF